MKDKPNVKVWLSEEDFVEAPQGTNLRQALKPHFHWLYNSPGRWIHCRGLGTCGTCSVFVDGPVSSPTAIEKWRLDFPPHKKSLEKGLRLACQTQVEGDVHLKKGHGLWGQHPLKNP